MLGKLILVFVLGVVGWLVYDHGRTLSEADVRTYYAAESEALNAYDSEAVCKNLADDFRGDLVEHANGQSRRKTYEKSSLCEENKVALDNMRLLSGRTQGLLSVEFSHEIKSIEIAPDGRTATVEVTNTARLGDVLLSRSRSRDQLSRTFWRVRARSSEGQAWAYGG